MFSSKNIVFHSILGVLLALSLFSSCIKDVYQTGNLPFEAELSFSDGVRGTNGITVTPAVILYIGGKVSGVDCIFSYEIDSDGYPKTVRITKPGEYHFDIQKDLSLGTHRLSGHITTLTSSARKDISQEFRILPQGCNSIRVSVDNSEYKSLSDTLGLIANSSHILSIGYKPSTAVFELRDIRCEAGGMLFSMRNTDTSEGDIQIPVTTSGRTGVFDMTFTAWNGMEEISYSVKVKINEDESSGDDDPETPPSSEPVRIQSNSLSIVGLQGMTLTLDQQYDLTFESADDLDVVSYDLVMETPGVNYLYIWKNSASIFFSSTGKQAITLEGKSRDGMIIYYRTYEYDVYTVHKTIAASFGPTTSTEENCFYLRNDSSAPITLHFRAALSIFRFGNTEGVEEMYSGNFTFEKNSYLVYCTESRIEEIIRYYYHPNNEYRLDFTLSCVTPYTRAVLDWSWLKPVAERNGIPVYLNGEPLSQETVIF